MLKKYPSRYIKIPVFLCLPPSFPRWHEVIRLPSSSPQITDYSDMFSESSVCSGLLSLRLSHFSFLTWLLSLLSVLPSLMNNSILLAKLLLSCLTLCNHMDHSLPGSSFHGILQARILEWVVISFSRGSSRCRDWTQVFSIAGRFFNVWATTEAILTQGEHIKSSTNLFYIQCETTRIPFPMWGDEEGSDMLNQVLLLFNSNTAPFTGLQWVCLQRPEAERKIVCCQLPSQSMFYPKEES